MPQAAQPSRRRRQPPADRRSRSPRPGRRRSRRTSASVTAHSPHRAPPARCLAADRRSALSAAAIRSRPQPPRRTQRLRLRRAPATAGRQNGIPHSGNQRSSSGSIGSSPPICAFSCSSRSVLRSLSPGAGHERVPAAPLVVVDEVDRGAAGVLEREHRAQQPLAVAAGLDRARDAVDRDDEVLDRRRAHDHPAEAVVVVGRLDGRLNSPAVARDDLLGVLEHRTGSRRSRAPARRSRATPPR